ncbi:MAG: hypothetical protein CMB80_19405 [Flammeovirgaceae bacterium]|nr:hypothetical protein [Flammeovirgaceae bacterium]MBE62508.1 hypothetical protein [Flammeovirgaceae bacterium]MBR08472.1 hypothetical protein [Rickettsiales bacterium]HCX22062.1 hypothetical protein [Cytophagales bacterium]|tara:strand:+ start:840 stop:1577 length:738 start_codon:yes stop_codon:yes gene_type:complete
MKKIIPIIMLTLLTYSSQAQLSDYPLDGEKTMRFALYYGAITNEWSGKIEDEKSSTVVFDWSQSRSTFGWGKYQNSHRYKIFGDVISMLYSGAGISGKPAAGTPILTSIFGWHNFAFSAFHSDYLQLSLGLHAGDYWYGIEPITIHKRSEQNTSGSRYYYGATGPAWMADVAIGNTGFWVHYEGAYAFLWGGQPEPDSLDVKPDILNQTFEVRWRQLFVTAEIVYGMNDWGNRIKRQQFGFGISI